MELLKRKIFDVLTEKITVQEFEDWLYNDEKVIRKIPENNLFYRVITINYRKVSCLNHLQKIAFDTYDKSETYIIFIELICRSLQSSVTTKEVEEILYPFMKNFDYETENKVYWKLYNFWDELDLIGFGYPSEKAFLNDVRDFAEKTSSSLKNCSNISEKRELILNGYNENNADLKAMNTVLKSKKRTLKDIFLAFLKKS